MLDLGTTFGWKQLGTTYVTKARDSADRARHNYEPGNRNDLKCVEAADAAAWAQALRVARASPHIERLIEQRADPSRLAEQHSAADTLSSNAPFGAVLQEFTEYASSGAFTFGPGRASTPP